MFAIFQVNAGFLKNQLTKYFYIRHLNPCYLKKKKKNCTLHRRIFQKRQFFTTFLVFLTVDEVCYISNKNQPFSNNLAKRQYFYTRDFISLLHFERKLALFIAKPFRKHPLFTTFSLFLTVRNVCNIQINTNFFINYLENIFTQDTFSPTSIQGRNCALHHKSFQKHFYYILLYFTNIFLHFY